MIDLAPEEMRDEMRAYLESFQGVPVEWGKSDCCAFMAGWIARRGIALELPAYSSERDAMRLIRAGLVEVLDGIAEKSGLRRTYDPQFGDVGVIETETGLKGAIWLHAGYVAVRTDFGFIWLQPHRIAATWKVV